LSRAQQVAAILSESGVLAVWLAFVKAWEEQRPSLADWAAAPRPRLDLERLAELDAARAQQADLLPRLDAAPLARLEGEERECARQMLSGWLADGRDEPSPALTARHAALLLAEMGHLTPQTIPLLCACLADPTDLTRYRARLALDRKHSASALGRETIEQMARCYRCQGGGAARAGCPATGQSAGCWREWVGPAQAETLPYAVDIYLDWSLKEIVHDRPDWLEGWAVDGNGKILSRVHRLDDAAWPAFLALLETAAPPVQQALLDSASWLLRRGVGVPRAQGLAPLLVSLLEAEDASVRTAAIRALGCLPQPDPAVMDRLLSLFNGGQRGEEGVLAAALARLAAQAEAAPRAQVEAALRAALPDGSAAAGWVRLLVVGRAGEDFDPTAMLKSLRESLSDARALLTALLRAGTDDDLWGGYHERVVALLRALVEGDGTLLEALLLALEEALAGGEWPPTRIALAAVAACAEVMPDALNKALRDREQGDLLVRGTRQAESHTARRQAITALSHLRQATPEVVAVLLAAARDVAPVQKDAVAAAARFRHLSRAFAGEDALQPLAEALTGPSGAAAYIAARLLGALGSSPAAIEVPGLREEIARLLGDACRHPNAQQEVYLFDGGEIRSEGPLSQTLLAELGRVWGLPE